MRRWGCPGGCGSHLPPTSPDMAQTRRPQHPNAVGLVGDGWSVRRRNGSRSTTRQHASGSTATAARAAGDRAAPPHPPRRMCAPCRRCTACVKRDWAASTTATAAAARRPSLLRYEREKPGELVHLDVKKLPAIPDGGGAARAGWRYVHSEPYSGNTGRLAAERSPTATPPTAPRPQTNGPDCLVLHYYNEHRPHAQMGHPDGHPHPPATTLECTPSHRVVRARAATRTGLDGRPDRSTAPRPT